MENMALHIHKKIELPELLNYTLGSAKDFQHKLRNRALDFDIKHFKKKIDMLIDMTYDIENNNNKDEL
jgi:hypothetical protein